MIIKSIKTRLTGIVAFMLTSIFCQAGQMSSPWHFSSNASEKASTTVSFHSPTTKASTFNLFSPYLAAAADVNTLQTAINSAESLLSGSTNNYPDGAIKDLRDCIKYAKHVISAGSDQTVIDATTTKLNNAINAFNAVKGVKFDDSGVVNNFDTNRGFKHPGMLHTQADFDRIKQQIASGNSTVTEAYNVLKNAAYAQSNAATYPTEKIVRGGGVGENYINAARGATIAYQNGLRWKIEGNTDCAQHAIDVIMAWVNTCTGITGNSNYALAAGIYGYEFANAAELVRDYNNWGNTADFKKVQKWFRDVWYPPVIGFLRGRNATWENAGKWWEAPGHYWSNWGLCNDLCLISIGILCDDPFIYNQGLSFYKYDQCNTWSNLDPNNLPDGYVWNWGLTEFIGNLVPIESNCPSGLVSPYGKLSQMQESGRDQGHTLFALGLAVDICQTGWNQGDDLFSYMNNRLAGGIEHVAAYNHANIDNVPFVTYRRQDSGYTLADGRGGIMTEVSSGGRGQVRPFWGRVIGHYEGVKGVKMTYSEVALNSMGIDGGGAGSVSGGYDHLGYTVLTSTYNSMATSKTIPTLLTPKMQYNGQTIEHNELGGLTNTYKPNTNTCVAKGGSVVLMPQLPSGVSNTGKWKWNTGQTTQNITVSTNKSYVYRVTYTNANGVNSEQVFTIAVDGDGTPTTLVGSIYSDTTKLGDLTTTVDYGQEVTLNATAKCAFGDEIIWSNGQTGGSITIPAITSNRTVKAIHRNQSGTFSEVVFTINVEGGEDYDNDVSEGKEIYDLTDTYANELSTASLSGWSNSGMVVNSNIGDAPYSNITGTANIDFPFMERWVKANSTLANTSITRTISNLPNGTYYVGGSFIATQQGDESATITGVTFSANGAETAISTGNGVPGVFSVKATVTNGTLSFGLNTSSTNANWIAMDNLFLYYAGNVYGYMRGANENAPARISIVNAGMDTNSGWSVAPTINFSCGEFYQKSFDLYQTLANAPAGKYVFKAQGFQRPGQAANVYSDFSSGNNKVAARLYAGSTSALLKNICAEAQSKSLGGNESSVGNGLYIPNNMEAASIYFANNLYNNSVETTFEGGDLKYGISATNNGSYNWTIFDNFELLYYGKTNVVKDPSKNATTYDITNAMAPYLSTTNFADWSNSGMALQNKFGEYSNLSDGASISYPFFERWIQSGTLPNVSTTQTITGLPAGKYYIGGSFIAAQQNDASVETTGAIFFAGNNSIELSTLNEVPEVYSLLVEVTDGTLTYGVKTQSTTANWVAMDNFFIKRVGTESDYLAQATADSPVRIVINNPRMEGSTSGWNLSGNTSGDTDIWQLQNANYANFNPTFMECWVTAENNLSDKSASQTLNLPQGLYKFSAAVNAAKQNSTDTATGCTLFIDDATTACATNDGEPEVFSVSAVLDAGKHNFGVNIKSANFNWFAWDNAVLYYYGECEDPTEALTMESGMQTFSSTHDLDFTDVSDDVRAFIAIGYSNGTLLLKSVTRVPAGTGLLLRGNSGSYDVPFADSGKTDDMSGNMLFGVPVKKDITTISDNHINYYLERGNGSYFSVVDGTRTIEAGSAYLRIPAVMYVGAKRINIGGNNATGINIVESNDNAQDNDEYYTLTGVKVNKPTKGVFIHNGKKVYIK